MGTDIFNMDKMGNISIMGDLWELSAALASEYGRAI